MTMFHIVLPSKWVRFIQEESTLQAERTSALSRLGQTKPFRALVGRISLSLPPSLSLSPTHMVSPLRSLNVCPLKLAFQDN